MPNPFFQFKRFTVFHDRCAMKVGTDGVLLGAWADCRNSGTILDVGTGSGLIALMLAQRCKATVYGIDIDKGAFLQAVHNVKNSPFSGQIKIIHSSLQDFKPPGKFDRIVSNPPYFVNSLKSPGKERSLARHNDDLSLPVFFRKSFDLLSESGIISLILPFEQKEYADESALKFDLHKIRETHVKPLPDTNPKRILLEYSKLKSPLSSDELCIELSRHSYSEEYITLTKNFYLKM